MFFWATNIVDIGFLIKLMMVKFFVFFLAVFCSQTVRAQIKTESVNPFVIGETRVIQSGVLNEERKLNIYLPHGFDKEKTHPVIYLLDGSADEDFLHIVGLVQFFGMQFNMPDFIVVGIANVDRKRDFTFHTDLKDLQKDYPTAGKSEKFIAFIETELQPYIQSTYKTNNTKYIIGQSLGGLLATEILLKKPKLFSHYLIVSPSLWWDNESLLKQASELLEKQPDLKEFVYISVGGKEHKTMQAEAKQLAEILSKPATKKMQVEYFPLANENHATILHQSIQEAFKILFPYK
jgi:predicted alpha/beta superfamily hydrolase